MKLKNWSPSILTVGNSSVLESWLEMVDLPDPGGPPMMMIRPGDEADSEDFDLRPREVEFIGVGSL
jgi:hypothetical protein